MNLADAPTLVADLLDEVCQSRETRSAVTLAIALVDRGRLSKIGDPVGLISEVIAELADAGLVTYRLRHDWAQIPLSIRATQEGYALAGYAKATPAVGSRGAKAHEQALHLGPTEFQNHSETAIGGPIERMSLADHLGLYPEHIPIHPHPWECGPYTGEPMSSSPEASERRKAERAQKAVTALTQYENGQATFSQLENTIGGGLATVSRYLDDARSLGLVERVGEARTKGTYWRIVPDAAPEVESLSSREQILKILAEGPIVDDKLLMNAMGGSWRTLGMHSLDHQLFSMEKAGLIEMDVKRNGTVQSITNIRLPKRMAKPKEPYPYAPRVEAPIELSGPTMHPESEVTKPTPKEIADVTNRDAFPILADLRARSIERDATNRRMDALLSAASVLDGVAQEESDRLMALATEMANGVSLTPVEAEYLAFAQYVREIGEAIND